MSCQKAKLSQKAVLNLRSNWSKRDTVIMRARLPNGRMKDCTMPAPLTKTPVEQELSERFMQQQETLYTSSLGPLRKRAFATFEQKGLPSRHIESWHFTDL